MAHSDAREGMWRGNWRMEWVASTLDTISEHGVSSITTADAHNSAASSRLNWRPRRFKWTRPFRWKTKSGFCACAITFQTQSTAVMYVLFGLTTCTAYGTQLQIMFVVNQTSLFNNKHNLFSMPQQPTTAFALVSDAIIAPYPWFLIGVRNYAHSEEFRQDSENTRGTVLMCTP